MLVRGPTDLFILYTHKRDKKNRSSYKLVLNGTVEEHSRKCYATIQTNNPRLGEVGHTTHTKPPKHIKSCTTSPFYSHFFSCFDIEKHTTTHLAALFSSENNKQSKRESKPATSIKRELKIHSGMHKTIYANNNKNTTKTTK